MNPAAVLVLIVLVLGDYTANVSTYATPQTALEEDFDKIFMIFKRLNNGTKNDMLLHELIAGADCLMRRLYYNWPLAEGRNGRNFYLPDEECTVCLLWNHFKDLVESVKGALPNKTDSAEIHTTHAPS